MPFNLHVTLHMNSAAILLRVWFTLDARAAMFVWADGPNAFFLKWFREGLFSLGQLLLIGFVALLVFR